MAPPTILATGRAGPHPSYVELARPFMFEERIQQCWRKARVSSAEEAKVRIQAIGWIDSVRKQMRLPVRTFNTAAIYYLKFRLMYPESGGFMDAAAAALFAACKIEDTLKKSREILCAAYNLKNAAAERLTPDDSSFELHSRTIIGLERLMLEASGFDFRNRHPQRHLLKILKAYHLENSTTARLAYRICLDLYRTLAPLKQTTTAMALASLELAMRLTDTLLPDIEQGKVHARLTVDRSETMETLLDLLDLYIDTQKGTIVGAEFPLDTFFPIRITLNKLAEAKHIPRYASCSVKNDLKIRDRQTNGASHDRLSPAANVPEKTKREPRDGTVRFMLDAIEVKHEQDVVGEYFAFEDEEYTVEVPSRSR